MEGLENRFNASSCGVISEHFYYLFHGSEFIFHELICGKLAVILSFVAFCKNCASLTFGNMMRATIITVVLLMASLCHITHASKACGLSSRMY